MGRWHIKSNSFRTMLFAYHRPFFTIHIIGVEITKYSVILCIIFCYFYIKSVEIIKNYAKISFSFFYFALKIFYRSIYCSLCFRIIIGSRKKTKTEERTSIFLIIIYLYRRTPINGCNDIRQNNNKELRDYVCVFVGKLLVMWSTSAIHEWCITWDYCPCLLSQQLWLIFERKKKMVHVLHVGGGI